MRWPQPMISDSTQSKLKKERINFFILFLVLFICEQQACFADEKVTFPNASSAHVLRQAEDEELKGNIKEAKKLYLKAAYAGNAEAHFKLSSLADAQGQAIFSREVQELHLIEAAKKGYPQAVEEVVGNLFFPVPYKYGGSNIVKANPGLAFNLYTQAKKANPELHMEDEEGMLETMQMCAEAGELNIRPLIKEHHIRLDGHLYDILYLAEEESKKEKLPKAKSHLVLQLICRGGDSLAPFDTFKAAVSHFYAVWKEKSRASRENLVFDRCLYFNSSYYFQRFQDCLWQSLETANLRQLKNLSLGLDREMQTALASAYQSNKNYIEAYIASELVYARNLQSPDGRFDTEFNTAQHLYDEYLILIKAVKSGFAPSPKSEFELANQQLATVYFDFISKRKKLTEDKGINFLPRDNEEKEIHNIWINYRDASAKLFSRLNPAVSSHTWKIWLTQRRTQMLLESIKDAETLDKEL